MKNMFLLLTVVVFCSGCSKSDEETQSESLGKEIANRMKAPIEKTQAITDKIGNIRSAENDLLE